MYLTLIKNRKYIRFIGWETQIGNALNLLRKSKEKCIAKWGSVTLFDKFFFASRSKLDLM